MFCLGVVGSISCSGGAWLYSCGWVFCSDEHCDSFCLGECISVAIVSLVAVDDVFLAEVGDSANMEDTLC